MAFLTTILLLWGLFELARYGKIVGPKLKYKRELKKQEERRKVMEKFWTDFYQNQHGLKQNAQCQQEVVTTSSPEYVAPAYRTCCSTEVLTETAFSYEEKNAIRVAVEYISIMAFSRNELIDQLELDGFETEAATIAADNIDVDWNGQAVQKAKEYLEFMGFSKKGLIEQLMFDGFTKEQAEYAVSAVGY